MSNGEQQIERMSDQPPCGGAHPDKIQQESQRHEGHGNECHQRDRDQVGCRAIDPRPVEVEQDYRHERKLDHEAGQE